jgi:hypothetical protein
VQEPITELAESNKYKTKENYLHVGTIYTIYSILYGIIDAGEA